MGQVEERSYNGERVAQAGIYNSTNLLCQGAWLTAKRDRGVACQIEGFPPMARVSWMLSMMLLLVICSQGVSTAPIQHLCGSHLVDALYFVCGERGFFYSPNHPHKRDVEHLLGFLSKMARKEQQLWRTLSVHDEPKVKRGIVEQCCHRPCGLYHLQGYCN
ncbi:preproinsulin b [Mastacembelus armatus]|uniref:preproinsulin b n=1 Tax=Mastacembelus armatus TaxID=205130 RepID=UPI000E45949F|nr:insulin-like [Mastacembelus armatus]